MAANDACSKVLTCPAVDSSLGFHTRGSAASSLPPNTSWFQSPYSCCARASRCLANCLLAALAPGVLVAVLLAGPSVMLLVMAEPGGLLGMLLLLLLGGGLGLPAGLAGWSTLQA
jgi:hypothetical protein